jgi:uncharacterized protein YlxW (UPF0749 family)
MSVLKYFKTPAVAVAIFISTAILASCGGVSDAQLAELYSLRDEVKSLEAEANRLKDERSQLESQIQDINRSLAECNKQKEETRANLDKLPK